MVHVIASVKVKTGRVNDFLEIFKSNIPEVIQEKGCIQYLPTIDINAGLPPQVLDEQVITIIEKWENLEVLHNHLETPHMLSHHEKVKDIVEKVSLKILQEV